MEFKIFVSYSSCDMEHVEKLREQLRPTPVKLFVAEDSIRPGGELSKEITRAITSCDLFLVIWSKNAKASDWVSQEIGQALALHKPIVPLVLDPDCLPSGFIEGIKYIRVFENHALGISNAEKIAMEAYAAKMRSLRTQEQGSKDGLVVLGLAAVLLWAFTRK